MNVGEPEFLLAGEKKAPIRRSKKFAFVSHCPLIDKSV